MNKYENLKNAKSNWYGELKRTIGIDNVNTLEELVELHTPKKATYLIKNGNKVNINCPICKRSINMVDFCDHCGQALDWEE